MNSLRTVYLLGAGASRDAGLPVSYGLTQAVRERLRKREPWRPSLYGGDLPIGPLTQALNATIAHIHAGDAYAGRPASSDIDIERLYTTVQMLAQSDKLEIAPFVETWRRLFPTHSDTTRWKHFIETVLGSPRGEPGLISVPTEPPTMPPREIYNALAEEIYNAIRDVLSIKDASAHSYLLPIIRSHTPRIATLNYDLGIENAANQAGFKISSGINNWHGGLQWKWPYGTNVHLLKLHGSLDWIHPYIPPGGQPRDWPRLTDDRSLSEDFLDELDANLQPTGFILGLRGKLRPDGPFLAMLHQFWAWLEDADRLIVIGYSFRDAHINTLINDWLCLFSKKALEVVDPAIPLELENCTSETPGFILQLLEFQTGSRAGCPIYPSQWRESLPTIKFHRIGAKEWLEDQPV